MKKKLIYIIAISTLLMSSMVFASSEVVEPTEEVVVVEEGVEPYVNILDENIPVTGGGVAYSSEFETNKNSSYINYDYTNYSSYPATVSLQVKTGINSWSTVGTSFVVQPGGQDHNRNPYTNIDPSDTYRIKIENIGGSTQPVYGRVQVAAY